MIKGEGGGVKIGSGEEVEVITSFSLAIKTSV